MPDQVDWRAIDREATSGCAVGRLLRDQREDRGLSIVDIEKRIRIRRCHLEAIEQGQFEKLPGAAYIPAFLRSYAAHVGLDPEKVLTAYHLSGPVPIERPISLPADFPIVERRAPIGLAVLTVLLVVGAGYGVWHYLPLEQTLISQKVPPVPDRLLASRPAAPSTASEPATSATTQAVTPTPTVPVATSPTTPVVETRSAPAALPPETWPAPRQEPVVIPAATLAPPVIVAAPVAPPAVVISIPGIGQAQAAQPPAPVEPQRASPPPTADVQQAVARDALPQSTATMPMQYDTSVLVSADSWVELRAPNGDILAQTYVRAGESYVVPAGIAYRIINAR